MEDFMRNMYIYESAACCPVGECGCDSDKELARVEDLVETFRYNGANITRYNIEENKDEFEDSKIVQNLMDQSGEDVLPIVRSTRKLLSLVGIQQN